MSSQRRLESPEFCLLQSPPSSSPLLLASPLEVLTPRSLEILTPRLESELGGEVTRNAPEPPGGHRAAVCLSAASLTAAPRSVESECGALHEISPLSALGQVTVQGLDPLTAYRIQ